MSKDSHRPQWMRSDGTWMWHEIADDAHPWGLCGAAVVGAVHQLRRVPVDGELCPECLAVRGVVEIVPRAPDTLGASAPVTWPDADPDAVDRFGSVVAA